MPAPRGSKNALGNSGGKKGRSGRKKLSDDLRIKILKDLSVERAIAILQAKYRKAKKEGDINLKDYNRLIVLLDERAHDIVGRVISRVMPSENNFSGNFDATIKIEDLFKKIATAIKDESK